MANFRRGPDGVTREGTEVVDGPVAAGPAVVPQPEAVVAAPVRPAVAPATQTVVTPATAPVVGSGDVEQVQSAVGDPYAPRRAVMYKVEEALYLVFGLIDLLIAIRFVLKLLGANPGSSFVAFVYGITAPMVAPFTGIFNAAQTNGGAFEPSDVVAILIWALVGWVLVRLAWLMIGETRVGMTPTSQVTRSRLPW